MKIDSTCAAVVTGGASGLGAATVRLLRSVGVRVAVFDRDWRAGESLARETGAMFQQVDVTDESSVVEGFARVRQAQGQERILVTCAGVAPAARTVGRDKKQGVRIVHDMELFARTVAVNLTGTMRCIAHSAAGMTQLAPIDDQETRGAIVTTSSIAAQDGQIGQAAYTASKGGVAAMTLPLARDLAGDGIRVNSILPGIFETPMVGAMPEAVREALSQAPPFPRRLGQPHEFAQMVLRVLEQDYLNGECIRLDAAVRMGAR